MRFVKLGSNFLKIRNVCQRREFLTVNVAKVGEEVLRKTRLFTNMMERLNNSNNISSRYFCRTNVSQDYHKEKLTNNVILLSCGLIIATMIMGSVTRKKKAGLSMTTWNFFGEAYPNTEEEWAEQFTRYQQIPEYKYSDKDMTLSDYKEIFLLEYVHRMLARLTGVGVLGASVLLWRMNTKGDRIRGLIYSGMVIAQGLLGWYMVKSGFDEKTINSKEYPTVSPYRLASHTGLALVLLSMMLYRGTTGSKVVPLVGKICDASALKISSRMTHFVLLSCLLSIVSGSYVAGTHSGLVHNTFPLMSGSYVPSDMFALEPKWRNFFENQATIQFVHRNLAYLTFGLVFANKIILTKAIGGNFMQPFIISSALFILVFMQLGIGAHCLMTNTRSMSNVHQANSIAVMSAAVVLAAKLAQIKKGKLK